MKYPINPDKELFKWGPLQFKFYFGSDFLPPVAREFAKAYPGEAWPISLVLVDNGRFVFINDFAKLRKNGVRVFLKYMINKKSRIIEKAKWEKCVGRLVKIDKEIEKINLSSLSDSNFISLWDKFHNECVKFWVHGLLPELANYGADKFLEDKLKIYTKDKNELALLMEILTAPEEPSFYQEEEIALIKSKNLEEHREKYLWLKNSYSALPKLDTYFFKERKEKLPNNIENDIKKRLLLVKKNKEEMRIKYNLPEELMEIAEAITAGITWQDERKKNILIFLHYSDLLLSEVNRRHGYDKKDLFNFSTDEITNMMKSGNVLSVGERKNAFGYLFGPDREKVYSEKEAIHLWEVYNKNNVSKDIREIKGIIVSKGVKSKISGKVKILLDPYEISTFNDGDILVCPMTSPEYVFAMKKAGAIITDNGGLTSHAAIVSRELGKPCIAGTKIATQVLHDGDLVEVDADKGVVRIIKKA